MMSLPALLCLLITVTCFGQVLPLFGISRPEVKPDDPFFFFGEELVLTCTLPRGNSSQARFMVGNDNVTEEHLSRPDERTLVYQQTVDVTGEFNNHCNGKSVTCHHPDFNLPGGQFVNADHRPEAPQNISCVYFDEEEVRCNWELNTPYSCPSNYIVYSFVNISGRLENCTETNTSCKSAKFSILFEVELLIQIRNKKRDNFTLNTTMPFNMAALVKLGPVMNLTPTTTSRSLHLRWNYLRAPQNVRVRAILTALNGTYKGQKFVRSVWNATQITVEGLHPAVAYSVSVAVRLKEGGIWSDAVSEQVTTLTEAPDIGPPSTPGAYTQASSSCTEDPASTRSVTVFWQELPEENKNGELTEYIIEYFPEDGSPGNSTRTVTVLSSETQALLPGLQCTLGYTVHIYAFNTKRSVNFTEITIPPPNSVAPVDQLLIRLSSNGVWGQWKTDSSQESFTLFWCRGRRNSPCSEGPVSWTTFPGNQREGSIPQLQNQVPSGISEYYMFGISTSTKQGSSGIVWQECFHRDNAKPSSPPQQVTLSNETDAVEVRWIPASCIEAPHPVYVDVYRIRWCLASNLRNYNCSSGGGKRLVSSKVGSARLEGLQPARDYMVMVEAGTLDGEWGPSSEPLPASLRSSATGNMTGVISGVLVAILIVAMVIFCIFFKKWRKMSASMDVKIPDDLKRHNFPHDGINNLGLVDEDEDDAIPVIPQNKFGTQLSNDSGMGSLNGSTVGNADSSEGDKNSPKTPSKVDDGSYIEAGLDHTICNGQGHWLGGGIVNFVTASEITGHLPRNVLNMMNKEGRDPKLAPVLETDIDEVMAPTTPSPIPGSPAATNPAGPGSPVAITLQGSHVAAANGPMSATLEVREGGGVLASQLSEDGVEHASGRAGKGSIGLSISHAPPSPSQADPCPTGDYKSQNDVANILRTTPQQLEEPLQATEGNNTTAPNPITGDYKSQNDVANILRTTPQQLEEPLQATEGNNTTAANPSTGNYMSQNDVTNIMRATAQQLAEPLQATKGNNTTAPTPGAGNYVSQSDVANVMGATAQQLKEPPQATEGNDTTASNPSSGNYVSQSDVANNMGAATQQLRDPLQATEGNSTRPDSSTGNYMSERDVANTVGAITQQLEEPLQATGGNNTTALSARTGNYVSQSAVADIMEATAQQFAEPLQATEGNGTRLNPSTGNYVSQEDVANNMGAVTQQLGKPLQATAPNTSTGNYVPQEDVANIKGATTQLLKEPLQATGGNDSTALNASAGNYVSQSDVADIMEATAQQFVEPLQATGGNGTRPNPSTGDYVSQEDVANNMGAITQQLGKPHQATVPNTSTGNYVSQEDVANIKGATTQLLKEPLQATGGNDSTALNASAGNYVSQSDVADIMGATTQRFVEPLQTTEGNGTRPNPSTGNYVSQEDVANNMGATTQQFAEPLQATGGNDSTALNTSTGNYVSQSAVADILATRRASSSC